MSERVYNFGAGPGTLPTEVLEQAREALLSFEGCGIGIAELSHRGAEYSRVHQEARETIKRLLGAGEEWELLFVQGGASLQFHMVPLNLGADADYVLTGTWSKKALAEAKRLGTPRVAGSSAESGFDRIPRELDLRADASYVHVTSNNTIFGTQWWPDVPQTEAPLVCDASSDILSRPLDLERYGLIYAGSQKNLGPAGVTVVLIRKELLERSKGKDLPAMLDYGTYAENDSLYNTPPTFTIFVVGLMAKWVEAQGGLAGMAAINERKAQRLYGAIDALPLYRGTAEPESRSRMNVTFRLTNEDLEATFLKEAKAAGLHALKGHRSVGGARASLYNALPEAGVEALVNFMEDFARRNG